MMAGDETLSIRDIHHRYGAGETAVAALQGVDLDIYAGKILLLVGPSGSGKTTLMQIMGCLLRPTRGQIVLNGNDVTAAPESQRNALRLENFGFIFQTNNLFPMLTATENVMVALDLLGIRGATARRRARDLLSSVGLGNRLNTFPAQLSGGQRQRVGIARALAGNPKILLADEPTAALDAENGHRVMELMRAMAHNDNRAIVIVTHDSRITDVADRTIHLEDGRISGPAAKGVRFA
jgi:putative ABC transport system ATP-binding protein